MFESTVAMIVAAVVVLVTTLSTGKRLEQLRESNRERLRQIQEHSAQAHAEAWRTQEATRQYLSQSQDTSQQFREETWRRADENAQRSEEMLCLQRKQNALLRELIALLSKDTSQSK